MGRAVFLNLWHGVPLKKVGYDDDKVKNWDSKGQKIRRMIQEIPLGKEYVVATSDFYAPIYESAFRRSKHWDSQGMIYSMIKVENFMLLISYQKRQKERKSSYIRRHTGKKVKWHFLWKNILILKCSIIGVSKMIFCS